MDLHKAVRDPWVWGQFALVGVILLIPPLLRAHLAPGTSLALFFSPAPLPWRLVAAVPWLAGAGMTIWGARSLGPNLTPGTEPLAAGMLVQRGAYGVVRHPLYLGLVLLLWGVAWGISNAGVGAVSGLVSLVYFDRKAAAEERWLARRFPAYAAYRDRVPKLIPRLPGRD